MNLICSLCKTEHRAFLRVMSYGMVCGNCVKRVGLRFCGEDEARKRLNRAIKREETAKKKEVKNEQEETDKRTTRYL